jgi:hypothetical protein
MQRVAGNGLVRLNRSGGNTKAAEDSVFGPVASIFEFSILCCTGGMTVRIGDFCKASKD